MTWKHTVVLIMAAAILYGCVDNYRDEPKAAAPQSVTAEQRQIIATALTNVKLPQPTSVELENKYLVVTFVGSQPEGPRAERFAKVALLAIRNAMVSQNAVTNYRVTLNGPPPGPGLILRYGSARFSEGGQLDWQEGR